jgi:integrase/recombinase XerC
MVLCRSTSLRTLEETRLPAAWALAECDVRTSELGAVAVGDLHLEDGRGRIGTTSRTRSRWVTPSQWGVTQLERRIRSLGKSPDQPLVYAGRFGSDYHRQAASCVAVSTVLRLAGPAGEPDVRPLSVVGWAGRQVLEDTGRIEKVARALGVRSLDRTARLIAWDWDYRTEAGK